MNTLRILYHLARADFLERTRRYSFLIILGLVLWLGYLSASEKLRMMIYPDYIGIIDSAWAGTTMALTVTMMLGFLGFYIVKGAVDRDYTTGVGQIMATTPISRLLYMVGKWLSNFAVLGVTIIIMMVAGIAMVLLFGAGSLDVVALVTPLALLGLPFMALVAALAVLFESVPWLRGGFGNVVYFLLYLGFIMISLDIVGQIAARGTSELVINPFIDAFGWQIVRQSVVRSAQVVYPEVVKGFSFGFYPPPTLKLFPYLGIDWTGSILLSRLFILLVAGGVAVLASLFFDRFNPSRPLLIRRKVKFADEPQSDLVTKDVPVSTVHLTPLSDTHPRFRFDALFIAELKLFLKGQRWWWYVIAAALMVAPLLTDLEGSRYLLLAAWVWPLLILSGLGCRENQFDTQQIIFSAPRPLVTQLPASWLSAFVVLALLGSGAFVKFLLIGDPANIFGWLTAVIFIPSLALALGVLTGSSKAFEVVYILWVYALTQNVAALDFAGIIAGSHFYIYALVAPLLLVISALARWRQIKGR